MKILLLVALALLGVLVACGMEADDVPPTTTPEPWVAPTLPLEDQTAGARWLAEFLSEVQYTLPDEKAAFTDADPYHFAAQACALMFAEDAALQADRERAWRSVENERRSRGSVMGHAHIPLGVRSPLDMAYLATGFVPEVCAGATVRKLTAELLPTPTGLPPPGTPWWDREQEP